MACAAYVVFYYATMLVVVVTSSQRLPHVAAAFAIGMLIMIALALIGLGLALSELLRNRNGRWLPSIGLLANGAGLIMPATMMLKGF